MEDLFRDYWWLIFPLGWMLGSVFTAWLNYRRQRDAINLIKSYAESGREPPAELLKVLNRSIDPDEEFWGGATTEGSGKPTNYWSLFGLFAVLAAGFGYAWWINAGNAAFAFGIVALTMAAVAVWSLINAAMSRPRR